MATMVAGQMEEENMEAVIAAAEAQGLMWEDLTPEQKQTLYRDYTGEELSISKIEDLAGANMGGTQAGRIFVADSPFEGLAKVGAAYGAKKKRDELSKQKAQAYELAGGLAAGEANQQRQHQMAMLSALKEKSAPPPQAPPQGPQGGGVPGAAPAPAPQGGAVPPTMPAGGGPSSPPGTFPQGGPPMRPGNPGAPAPNAPAMDPSRGGQPASPVPGNPQEWTDKLRDIMPNRPQSTPGINPGEPTPPKASPSGQGGEGGAMGKLLEKLKLDELLKKLRMGG